jgi:hypothetical protein
MLREPLVKYIGEYGKRNGCCRYCDFPHSFDYKFLFSAVFTYSSKGFSRVAVSDPSNKDDR